MTGPRFFLFAAAACFLLGLIITLGASVFGSTWEQWALGGLLAWVVATLVP